ncbi:DUF72 domain-containing protein [Candidatus Bathyarchaeota archaeon]|nr:DUF72 domain-containing protein [Candidatus Bathyarchaeota archaeon]
MIRVGCCGWGRISLDLHKVRYFASETKGEAPRKGGRPSTLQLYAEYFDVVEVNSSFYSHHKPSTYEGWRKAVPPDFEFTVKCHRDVTHKFLLKPTDECVESFNSTLEGALACKARAILLQTPASFQPSEENFHRAEEFFRSIERSVPIVWETRGDRWLEDKALQRLRELLERHEITHVTDILKAKPAYVSGLAYFRLHGLPGYNLKYSYRNEDLRRLLEGCREVEEAKGKVYLFFNNYAMYIDGVRFKRLLESGELPESPFGSASIRIALSGVDCWPASKGDLLARFGEWYVWVEPDRNVKLKEILNAFTDRVYENLEDLASEAERVMGK